MYLVTFHQQICAPGLSRAHNSMFFQLAGGTVLALGVWTLVEKSDYISLLSSSLFSASAYILIAAGAIVIVTGMIGCCATLKEKKSLLIVVKTDHTKHCTCDWFLLWTQLTGRHTFLFTHTHTQIKWCVNPWWPPVACLHLVQPVMSEKWQSCRVCVFSGLDLDGGSHQRNEWHHRLVGLTSVCVRQRDSGRQCDPEAEHDKLGVIFIQSLQTKTFLTQFE